MEDGQTTTSPRKRPRRRICCRKARRSIGRKRTAGRRCSAAKDKDGAALDKGAEVDRAHKDGKTPLFIACSEGRPT